MKLIPIPHSRERLVASGTNGDGEFAKLAGLIGDFLDGCPALFVFLQLIIYYH